MKNPLPLFASLFDPGNPPLRGIAFGAAGGMLSVLAGIIANELQHAWYVIILPYMALGAGAAFASVLVLLGIKTEDVWRCCGVALLAGFFWQPVFDAGREYVLHQPDRAAEAETVKVSDKLEETLTSLHQNPTNTALIECAGNLTDTLTHVTPDLRPSPARMRAKNLSTRAVNVLGEQAEKGQPAAINAVVGVAETAAASGNRDIIEKARVQVQRLPETTNKTLQNRKLEIMRPLPAR